VLGLGPVAQPGRSLQEHLDVLTHAEIRVEEGIGMGKLKEPLTVLGQGSGQQSPASFLPPPPPVPELEVPPDIVRPLVLRPHTGTDLGREGPNVAVELPHADVADLHFLEEVLVEEAAVEAHDGGHSPSVVFADQRHHVAHQLLHTLAGLGVFLSAPEDRINEEAAPSHLKRGESLRLVGGLHTVTDLGLVTVHDHGVDAEDHDGWSFEPEATDEQA